MDDVWHGQRSGAILDPRRVVLKTRARGSIRGVAHEMEPRLGHQLCHATDESPVNPIGHVADITDRMHLGRHRRNRVEKPFDDAKRKMMNAIGAIGMSTS